MCHGKYMKGNLEIPSPMVWLPDPKSLLMGREAADCKETGHPHEN